MRIIKFDDIIAWQKSKDPILKIYKAFEKNKDLTFKNQIERVSVMNIKAEGFDRQTNKEFNQFLYIAKGSCAEVRSRLYLPVEIEKNSKKDSEDQHLLSEEISKLISGFLNI